MNEVLWEGLDALVVAKPAGMLVHRGWDRDDTTLVDLVRDHLGVATVHPVHRLDRGASGALIFAKNPAAARALQAQFDADSPGKGVEKTYLVLVRGVAPDAGTIDHPIPRKEGGERVDARSHFRRLAHAETSPRHTSLVAVSTESGRLHQVRRHMKHIDHPLIGDSNYGKGPLNRALREAYGLDRLALHAWRLAFDDLATGLRHAIVAPIPDDLAAPLARMGYDVGALDVADLDVGRAGS